MVENTFVWRRRRMVGHMHAYTAPGGLWLLWEGRVCYMCPHFVSFPLISADLNWPVSSFEAASLFSQCKHNGVKTTKCSTLPVSTIHVISCNAAEWEFAAAACRRRSRVLLEVKQSFCKRPHRSLSGSKQSNRGEKQDQMSAGFMYCLDFRLGAGGCEFPFLLSNRGEY